VQSTRFGKLPQLLKVIEVAAGVDAARPC